MAFSPKQMLHGAIWTIGAYGASVGLRFGSNVILSRLVVPEVFGVMLIINTLRMGIELFSDVGIGQNIVQNPKGESRSFLDVAWTIQLGRGLVLFSLLFFAAAPLGQLYQLPTSAIQLSALTLAIMGAASISIYLLQRRLQFVRLNLFDLSVDAVGAVLTVGLALLSPTIWSLILANILTAAIRTIATYLLPEARNWLAWDRSHVRDIVSFGKWIYLSSILAFLCASFDKLYLGQSVPLALLGIYGLARNVADLPAALFARLGHSLVFPVIAAQQQGVRHELRARIAPLRFKLLLCCAACIAFGATFADYAVMLIYDARYQDAGWMLPVMLVAVWVSILCSMNEYALMGLGKPLYGAGGNLVKLISLAVGIPLALSAMGVMGVILVIALGDIGRYIPILAGQRREGLSFLRQDVALSATLLLLLAGFTLLRWQAGFGTAFDLVRFS
ncbi:oligosaccharide flippase family protein [Devosia sp. A449]